MKPTKRQPRSNLGVWVFDRPERPNAPYCVQRNVEGKRETVSFARAEDRDRLATEWRGAARARSLSIVPGPREIEEFRAFKSAIGADDWRLVVDYWRSRSFKGLSMTVRDMVEIYRQSQTEKVRAQKLDEGSKKRHLKIADELARDLGSLQVGELTAERLTEWLDEFEHDSPHTFNSYLRVLRAVWNSAEINPNIPKKVSYRNATPEEVAILTVEETRRLFSHGLKHMVWLMPRLAAEAFAGLRYSSAVRLEKEDVNVSDRGILLPAKKLKTGMRTGRRHYIDGLPDNLWQWIELADHRTWSLSQRQYMRHKSRLFTDAKVPHPKNCLRHSACTYHVAAFKDPGKTATMLCHTDQAMLWSNYNGRATQTSGVAYFAITPESCRKPAKSTEDSPLPVAAMPEQHATASAA
jgi:integrase